jgi:coatomer subunit beta'
MRRYAVRESTSKIKLFKAFKEKTTLKTTFSAEGVFGGAVLGVRSGTFLCLYDWATGSMVRRIDVIPTKVGIIL